MTRLVLPRQDMARQYKTIRDKTRQDTARQDKTTLKRIYDKT